MKLIAFEVALQALRELQPVLEQIRVHDAHLADQLFRAAKNAAGNLCEGERRQAGNKRRAWEIAHGEANEAMGWLLIAEACGYALDDAQVRRTMDRLLGLMWGLVHRRA
jgi:four helix bundle protein